MKGRFVWLGTALIAFFLGRRSSSPQPCVPTFDREDSRRGSALRPLLAAVAAGLVEAWRAAARGHARPARYGRTEAVGGRLGGAAGSLALPRAPAVGALHGLRPAAPPAPASAPSHAPSPREEAIRKAVAEPSALVRWWLYARELLERFGRDQCSIFAAALSFFGLVSMAPLLLLALAALGYMLHDPKQAQEALQGLVAHVLPGGQAANIAQGLMREFDIAAQVEALQKARGVSAVIGLVSLIWAAMQIFVSSAPPMNAAWEVEENRSWIRLRLTALGLLIGAGTLFLLSLVPSSGPDLIRRLHIPWLGLPEHVPASVHLVFALLGVAINAAMFTLIYRYLPAAKVSWREAAVGGLFMGGLWELAKQGFSLYLAHFGTSSATYKAFGGVVLFVVWVYYTSMLLLLGAELSSLYRDICEAKGARRRTAAASIPS